MDDELEEFCKKKVPWSCFDPPNKNKHGMFSFSVSSTLYWNLFDISKTNYSITNWVIPTWDHYIIVHVACLYLISLGHIALKIEMVMYIYIYISDKATYYINF